MNKIYFFACAFSLMSVAQSIHAQGGYTDLSFGNDGLVTNEVFPSDLIPIQLIPTETAIFSVTAGSNISNINLADSYIQKYTTSGAIDNDFGVNGRVMIDQTSIFDAAINAQENRIYFGGGTSDNQLPVAGYVDIISEEVVLVSVPLDDYFYYTTTQLEIADDGKVVLLGLRYDAEENNWIPFVIRLNEDLTMDTTFSENGHVESVTQPYSMTSAIGSCLLGIAPSGTIFINYMVNYVSYFHKITPDGIVDDSFLIAAEVSETTPTGLCQNILVLGENDIYILLVNSEFQDQYVIKINGDGSLNTTFGVNGIAAIAQPSANYRLLLTTLAAHTADEIVLMGYMMNTSDYYGQGKCLFKMDSNGNLEDGYGGSLQAFAYNGANNFNYSTNITAVQPDGKVLSMDLITQFTETSNFDLMLTRFNDTGQINSVENAGTLSSQPYPNPCQNQLTIPFATSADMNATAAIFNVSGQCIAKDKIAQNTLNTAALPSGIYSVQVIQSAQTQTFKFVKE